MVNAGRFENCYWPA